MHNATRSFKFSRQEDVGIFVHQFEDAPGGLAGVAQGHKALTSVERNEFIAPKIEAFDKIFSRLFRERDVANDTETEVSLAVRPAPIAVEVSTQVVGEQFGRLADCRRI